MLCCPWLTCSVSLIGIWLGAEGAAHVAVGMVATVEVRIRWASCSLGQSKCVSEDCVGMHVVVLASRQIVVRLYDCSLLAREGCCTPLLH